MKPQKMLITLQLNNDESITRTVISTIPAEMLQDIIVEMHEELLNKKTPTF